MHLHVWFLLPITMRSRLAILAFPQSTSQINSKHSLLCLTLNHSVRLQTWPISFCPTPALSLAPEILANDRTPGADPEVYETSLWQGLCSIPQVQDTFMHCRHVLIVLAMGSMGRFSTTAKPHMASSSALKAARFFSDLSVSAGLSGLDQCKLPLKRNQ